MSINKSLILGFLKKKLNSFKNIKPEYYLFIITTLFYLTVWIINPSNKLIVGSFIAYIYLLNWRLKHLRKSLLLGFLVSTIVFTGKRYSIELIPPGIFDIEVFPNGYVVDLIVTPAHVIAAVMAAVWLRDFVVGKFSPAKIFTKLNLLLIGYYALILISDLFGSGQTNISLLFSVLAFNGLILYFFLQAYSENLNKILLFLVSIFCSIVVFESFISFQQYLSKSPIGKNLESQLSIETWGREPDELEFTYRPTGTFHHANSLASDLVFWLTLIFTAYLKSRDRKLVYILGLGLAALTMTLSRSAWIGFGASIVSILFIVEKLKRKNIIPLLFNKKILWLLLLVPFLLYFFVLPRAEKSIYSFSEGAGYFRLEQIEPTLKIIMVNPILGIGRRMLVLEALDLAPESVFGRIAYEVHNWYLLTAAEHGLFSLVIFMVFLLISVKLITLDILSEKLSSLTEYFRIAVIGGAAAFLLMGLFQTTSGEFYLLTFLGLLNGRKNISG